MSVKCPGCPLYFSKRANMKRHASKAHPNLTVSTLRTKKTDSERKEAKNIRNKMDYQRRKVARTPKSRIQRSCTLRKTYREQLTETDAKNRGHSKAKNPTVHVKPSKLKGAGNGAAVDLFEGDFVTMYECVDTPPPDNSYTIDFGQGEKYGIREIPTTRKYYAGSFINRSIRGTFFKANCTYAQYTDGKIYIRMTRDMKEGEELFAIYGK
ncbi:hypothetical protein AeMF1_003879 [Aphanomyces euteiches]|nr:hypothetical protein AeMF1_003879 [Aphanomyces euteiches]